MDKTFINGIWIKKFEFTNGGNKLDACILVETLYNQLRQLKNEKGYVYVEIKQRTKPDERGNTHYMCLSEYKPKEKQAGQAGVSQEQKAPPANNHQRPQPQQRELNESMPTTSFADDIPF